MFARAAIPRQAFFRNASHFTKRFASTKTLRETLQEVIPAKQEQLKKLKTEHGNTVVGDVKVDNIIGGMRGLKAMLWDASVLDPIEGIRFHGLSIPDCQKVLPPAPGGKEILPESMLWLLLTGQVPTPEQTLGLSRELAEKGELPKFLEELVDSFPQTLHPMTQLSMAVAALNHDSSFQAAYEKGIKKTEYWTHTLEDCINLIARLPALAARIYRNVYKPGTPLPAINKDLDLVGNYSNLLGYGDNESLTEYLRLYIALHGDHEGGNASAHTAHLVGSTLADPYLAYSAALSALAGPLHGLANQEVLRWQMAMQKELGSDVSLEQIKEYLWKTLKSGQVVPGYGHGVLRNPDPRFIALQEFCETRPELRDSPIIKLVQQTFQVAPDVLKEHGKTKNPYPNVDAASGTRIDRISVQFNAGCIFHFRMRPLPLWLDRVQVLHRYFRCFQSSGCVDATGLGTRSRSTSGASEVRLHRCPTATRQAALKLKRNRRIAGSLLGYWHVRAMHYTTFTASKFGKAYVFVIEHKNQPQEA